jgi:hypothetical protein
MRLDDQFDAYNRRGSLFTSQYYATKAETGYSARIYQATGMGLKATVESALSWSVRGDWLSFDTDISVLEVKPETPTAITVAPKLRYLDWYLRPPRVGAAVRVCGYPDAEIDVDGEDHDLGTTFGMESARVVEHLYPIAHHGMGEFPTFRLDHVFDHGFSGGPVLWNDRLVGIFTGPDLVSCLWPLALLDHAGLGGPCLADAFDTGLIRALDWGEIKGHVKRVPCDEALAGRDDHERCTKNHVILQ